MKNLLKQLLTAILISLSFLFAGMMPTELLFVPWGDEANELEHHSYPGLHTGPLSFQVNGDDIIIFDTENKALKTYRNNELVTAEALNDPYIIDFYVNNNDLYTMDPQHIYKLGNGIKHKVASIDDPKYMFDGLKNENGAIVSKSEQGKVFCSPRSLNKGDAAEIRVTRTIPATLNVQINDKAYELYMPNVGSVEYIGSTPDQQHYIYAESMTQQVPLKVERRILLIDNDADVLNTLYLPDQKYTYIFKEFFVDEAGALYHMQSSKDGIHILKWQFTDDNNNETVYPDAFSESYHFNDFVEAEPELQEQPSLYKTANSDVSRAEALTIADEYVTHTWTATSSNIGTTSTVTTPSWIVVGSNTRVPYKWGGWSTVAQFDDGIAAGKLAGDINTSAVDWGNSVGADCSGFVSVCWKASQKYGTSTISGCSHQLSSYNDLLPADATNKAGSHIRLVVEWTTDGKLRQVEETASGTPGWAARYYTWRLSDITAYVPIRYDQIQNSLAPRPTLLSVLAKEDSVSLSWTADESTVFSGYRIYGMTTGETYHVLAEVMKGTQSATIAQPVDYHYQYFVAAYTNGDSANYNPSDIYAAKYSVGADNVLIVDGFDRASGSYSQTTHQFGALTAFAMDHYGVNYDVCANDAVITGNVDLKAYDLVWWICGDESTADETFNDIEQDSVESYLDNGGKFFVSGSEIGWDLDYKGAAGDKSFIHDYLKAAYDADDAGSYTVNGVASTAFDGLSLSYSENGSEPDTYAEDYPDAFSATGGSQVVLKYANGKNAATAYSGLFPGGTVAGKVMVMGFPFETITIFEKKALLAGGILEYMELNTTTGIGEGLPKTASLHQNYPNPFNPMTSIVYDLNKAADVTLRVYNVRGELVRCISRGYQPAGTYKVIFSGTMLPSGMYVYGLEINGEMLETGKMILNK